jgi:aspartyl-tRNA(Asn)/glutamyl-tRNA(Gln) amidotransferase subunit A
MKDLSFLSIRELKSLIEKNEIKKEEVLDFYIEKFKTLNGKLNCALEIFDKKSILENSSLEGLLSYIPGIIKDTISQKGRSLTCGSKILKNFVTPYDATVIEKLKNEGALLIG